MPDRPVPPPAAAGSPAPREADMTRTYALVLAIEAVVIVALYWLGQHFS